MKKSSSQSLFVSLLLVTVRANKGRAREPVTQTRRCLEIKQVFHEDDDFFCNSQVGWVGCFFFFFKTNTHLNKDPERSRKVEEQNGAKSKNQDGKKLTGGKKSTDLVSDKHLMTVTYKGEAQKQLLVKFWRMASAQGEGMQETWRELMVGKT